MPTSDSFYDTNVATARTVVRDFIFMTVGDKIGSGQNRTVYEYQLDTTKVLKFEATGTMFQNTIEWKVWQHVKNDKRLNKWFAPCYTISPWGGVLVQARVAPLTPKRAPKKMPAFLCDFKYANYGIYNGRVVCCDYGLPALLFDHGLLSTRMKKVKWWTTSP